MSTVAKTSQRAPLGPSDALNRLERTRLAISSRAILRVVCTLFAVLVIWSLTAKLDIVAVAEGRLVPKTYVKIVQPSDAGIVREILVQEGEKVRKGQVLIRLDATVTSLDRTALARELAQNQLQLRRIEAQLNRHPMKLAVGDDSLLYQQVQSRMVSHQQAHHDGIAQERAAGDRADNELKAAQALLDQYQRALPSYERSAKAYADLAKQKLVGQLQAEEREREALERAQQLTAQRSTVEALRAAVRQSAERRSQMESAYRSDLNAERLEIVNAVGRLQQETAKAQYRSDHLELRASQDGIVKDLATTTTGAVVQPGSVLLTLVPIDEPLRAEVQIQNKDIGFVQRGQSVRLKIAPYAFQKYGVINGAV